MSPLIEPLWEIPLVSLFDQLIVKNVSCIAYQNFLSCDFFLLSLAWLTMTFKKSHSLFSTPSPKTAETRSVLSHLLRLNTPNFLSLLLQPHGCPGCLCQTSYSLSVLSTVESQTGHSIYGHSLTELTGGNCHFSTLMTTVL